MFKKYFNLFSQHSKKLILSHRSVMNRCLKTKNSTEAERIVWMDLEMTGLNIENCHIMEVACIVTDGNLNIIAECPDIVINHPSEVLESMNPWCIIQHGKTGLTDACRNSKITLQDAEKIILNFFDEHVQPAVSPLAGNSVWCDRIFLKKYMPLVENYLHYRIIDVSTVKELCRRWNPEIYSNSPKKQFLHRSLQDIKESINELKWYQQNFLKINNS